MQNLVPSARVSKKFHASMNDLNLIEYSFSNRKFTWTNGRHFALLDRFLFSMDWDRQYSCTVKN
jgi:hypothetical protein